MLWTVFIGLLTFPDEFIAGSIAGKVTEFSDKFTTGSVAGKITDHFNKFTAGGGGGKDKKFVGRFAMAGGVVVEARNEEFYEVKSGGEVIAKVK
ncbi:hypothetical protein AGMMS49936_10420 [Endomicrobiia bacterium]|nr:hypothetical protein AGMMS49936_10420 [Endomicrobiia bacterium]